MACWNIIDHNEFSSGANSYTKSSIPSSYDHLCFIASIRTDASGVYTDYCEFYLNNDSTTSKYSQIYMSSGTGSMGSSKATSASATLGYGGEVCGASALADTFSTVKMWIPNYADTSNYKQILGQIATPNNDSTNYRWNLYLSSGLFLDTSAIDQFTYMVYGGSDNMVQYSSFTLYGINGAG